MNMFQAGRRGGSFMKNSMYLKAAAWCSFKCDNKLKEVVGKFEYEAK